MKKTLLIVSIIFNSVIAQEEISLENIFDGTFSTEGIGRYEWKNNSDSYFFSKSSEKSLDFFELEVSKNDTTKSFSISKDLIDNFSYSFSPNQDMLLLKKNHKQLWRHSSYGTYYVYNINQMSLKPISSQPDSLRNVKFSPDSKKIAYVRNDNNLYMYEISEEKETQLTFDGSDTILNGHFGWVYEEEFGTYDSYKWSPNSQFIAFIREDQELVREYALVDYEEQYPVVKYIRYPKAGEDNPIVSIIILDLLNEEYRTVNLPDTSYYIPDIVWQVNSSNLFFATLNRKQNDWNLYKYDFDLNNGTLILNDKNDTWIDRDPITIPGSIGSYSAKGGFSIAIMEDGEIIWLSERDGYRHIYRNRPDGKFFNQITRGDWEVNTILSLIHI